VGVGVRWGNYYVEPEVGLVGGLLEAMLLKNEAITVTRGHGNLWKPTIVAIQELEDQERRLGNMALLTSQSRSMVWVLEVAQ
jgi:hypothetical protein